VFREQEGEGSLLDMGSCGRGGLLHFEYTIIPFPIYVFYSCYMSDVRGFTRTFDEDYYTNLSSTIR